MSESSVKTIYLKDYQAPAFELEKVKLTFHLFEEGATVLSVLNFKRCAEASDEPLYLNGEDLELRSIKLNNQLLSNEDYQLDQEGLTIKNLPVEFTLECETWIKPQNNKRLEGLYKSSAIFCTQCEAEGFRRITYFPDRPDVMSVFQTRIEADKALYPILLSNGNPIESGDLPEGRHFVTWEDPFPKPCYLFALVAGDLHCQEDAYVTRSGRRVDLRIFVDAKNADKCDYALDSLKRAMKWDEDVYGREYDLDIFMIVAVDDFNMGAMENKGLNIFNSSCVLAKTDTATDTAYLRIEAIVAHEYFHNWSGNRVTCRDWFQLSLKEGFTVFRDAEFSADMNSRVVKRIEDVNFLRTAQFAEDAGPMSHPVRPSSYMEISNFYTLTVYEKGEELVRMLHTLLGEAKFRAGSDLYFDRHDGQAVTTEDFVMAMSEVSGRDFTQFQAWYDQGGTPEVLAKSFYDVKKKEYHLTFTQTCPASAGDNVPFDKKALFHIPIAIGLIDDAGQDIPLSVAEGQNSWVFELVGQTETIVFEGVEQEPTPSLLRNFSAPVKLTYDYTNEQLLFLLAHDSDGFNRWEAGQTLSLRVLQDMILKYQNKEPLVLSEQFVEVFRSILRNKALDKAMVCKLLMLPAESYLIELSVEADVAVIHHVREFVRAALSDALRSELEAIYHENMSSSASLEFSAMSQRALKNSVLALLSASPNERSVSLAKQQFDSAVNMTDSHAALSALVNSGNEAVAQEVLTAFYNKWHDDAQVIEQWFAVQSGSSCLTTLEKLKKIIALPDFDITNPNKVRAVIGVFCQQNLVNFHDESGDAYKFLAEYIIRLDDLNPQIASRLMMPLTRWRKFNTNRQNLMIEQLKRIYEKNDLSKDVREILEKSLP
ncbi:MAG: aminopeptidase N [Pseudohongiellaceae bacterium]|jgi:aminopeptidase N